MPQPTLMENAGRSAAQILDRLHPDGEVLALVGAGNNGGDALVLLRTLAAWGRPVTALVVADREEPEPVLHGWDLRTIRDEGLLDHPDAYDDALSRGRVLVDGILGTGIRGAPRQRQAAAIRAVNRSPAPVLALDIPSGVNAGTGAVPGEAVEAEVTVAFGWPKLGSLLHPGRSRVGRLVAVEIGFPPGADEGFGAALVTPAWAASHRPRRAPETHKYEVGALTLLAGREGMAGAAIMAARAAMRAGVGLLRVASVPGNRVVLQTDLPEAIFVDATDPAALAEAVEGSAALAAGPGLGTDEDAGRRLGDALEATEDRAVLLDADALTLVGSGKAPPLESLGGSGPVLLTPHPGEMARITGVEAEEVKADRVGAARKTASRTGCAVLLKGLPSVVASPEGPLRVDTVGSSDLATAGMGDVLTGVAASFLAQGSEPGVAGALGLHVSGRAAARARRGAGLVPGDVIEHLPDALEEEGPGETGLDLPFVVFDQDSAR